MDFACAANLTEWCQVGRDTLLPSTESTSAFRRINGARRQEAPEGKKDMEMKMDARICQSCAMPMPTDDLLGTEKGGGPTREYCKYCYADGSFTNPECTIKQMEDICVPIMTEEGMPEAQARAIMQQTLPVLKRWKA